MYGEAEKDERYRKVDDEFREAMLKKFGIVENAVIDFINNAWILFYRNDLETAMRRFNQAWLLDPEFPDAYFGFAALLEMRKENEEAARFYRLGVEKDTENMRTIICYQRISECKEQLNDIQGAIEALSKIKMLQPDESFVYKRLGFLYVKMDDKALAMEAYDKAIELDPKDAVTFHNRAYLYQTMEDYTQAITDYTRSVKLDPTYVSSYVNRGMLEMQTGNYEASKQDFQTGIKYSPRSAELRRLLGLAKLNLGDKLGACDDFKIAKEFGDPVADQIIEEFCK
jgi:tetratricopeptide (TPR) repeat protein